MLTTLLAAALAAPPKATEGRLPVTARPLAAWRLAEYTVTAVLLRNQTPEPVALDPRRLNARLYAASFQHAFLGPRGTPQDTSVAYLVTLDGGLDHP